MDTILYYAIPFLKNLGVLYLTVFMAFFIAAIVKNKGLVGFSFSFWVHDNANRFKAGAVFIAGLSLLMAVTDASPLFHWIGLDINASPVALGMAIAVLLGLAPTKIRQQNLKTQKVKEIQVKASEIVEKSAEIVKDADAATAKKATPKKKPVVKK